MIKSIFSFATLAFVSFSSFGQSWTELHKTIASDRALGDEFGSAVSISGDYAVIGAPLEDEDQDGQNTLSKSGSVYVYKKSDLGTWDFHQKLVTVNRKSIQYFGNDLAIEDSVLVVGAYKDNYDELGENYKPEAGAVYIFKLSKNEEWSQTQKLVAFDREDGDEFGKSVDVSEGFIVVGCPESKTDELSKNTLSRAGAVYIYENRNGSEWKRFQKITADTRYYGDEFGTSVAISKRTLIVGAPNHAWDKIGGDEKIYAGAVYMFECFYLGIGDDELFFQTKKIVSTYRDSWDYFGRYIDIDGETAVVGVPENNLTDEGYVSGSGAVYVLNPSHTGWGINQVLIATDRVSDHGFGSDVALSGRQLVVGAVNDKHIGNTYSWELENAGAAYVFGKNSNGVWNEIQKIIVSDTDEDDALGTAVAIDKSTILLGAKLEDDDLIGSWMNSEDKAGSAYFIENPEILTRKILSNEFSSTVFPNPFNESFYLSLDKDFNYSEFAIKDIGGRTLKTGTLNNENQVQLTITGEAGVYFVHLKNNDGQVDVIRVIKQ